MHCCLLSVHTNTDHISYSSLFLLKKPQDSVTVSPGAAKIGGSTEVGVVHRTREGMQICQGIDSWLLPSVDSKIWRRKLRKTNTAKRVSISFQINTFSLSLSSCNLSLYHLLHI